MFQLVVDVLLVAGALWLFLTGIFWMKKQVFGEKEQPAADQGESNKPETGSETEEK